MNKTRITVRKRYFVSVSTSSIGHQVVHYFIPDPTEKSRKSTDSTTFSEIREKFCDFLDPLLLATDENTGF